MKPLSLALRVIEWLAALLTAGMVAVIFVQVSNRYIFNSPIAWTEEVARLMFIWLSFLGAFLALREHSHISIHAVMKCFSPGVQATVSSVVTFLLFCYMTLPFSSQFNIDPLHLGILSIAAIGIGIFLPPIGVGMFIACTFADIESGFSSSRISRGSPCTCPRSFFRESENGVGLPLGGGAAANS